MTGTSLVALLDGRLLPATEPLLRPDDAGVVRGDGVFETTLAVDGEPRDLSEHLDRLGRSAAALEVDIPDRTEWSRGVDAVLADRPAGQWSVRLTATRGPDDGPATCFVVRSPVGPRLLAQRQGIGVLALDRGFDGPAVARAPWLLAGAKTLSYATNMAALRWAAAHGADDVVFVGTDGTLLEAPTATVVLARGRSLVTPPPEGILAGITAERLFAAAAAAGWAIARERVTVADLFAADAVWLTSSVRLLAPVTTVDGRALPAGRRAGLTGELAALLDMPAPAAVG
ncbi:aminotransferase class IV [Nakamurella endophytica]|uniref:aminotransferase class IV n=1 Tax=Nakamurella endophytica TaxID=1748367 RepID=UPI00166801ED|nr:aminotransferase class IV [Nakamurella endophytica]